MWNPAKQQSTRKSKVRGLDATPPHCRGTSRVQVPPSLFGSEAVWECFFSASLDVYLRSTRYLVYPVYLIWWSRMTRRIFGDNRGRLRTQKPSSMSIRLFDYRDVNRQVPDVIRCKDQTNQQPGELQLACPGHPKQIPVSSSPFSSSSSIILHCPANGLS